MMKAQKNDYGDWIVMEGMERYSEKCQAEPTSRLLEGSRDHGYAVEYVGYGTIDNVPVKAIYLLDDQDMSDIYGEHEDASNYDWDQALNNGRIIVNVDRLTDNQWDTLQTTEELNL